MYQRASRLARRKRSQRVRMRGIMRFWPQELRSMWDTFCIVYLRDKGSNTGFRIAHNAHF